MIASFMTFFDGFLSENCSFRTRFDSDLVLQQSDISPISMFASPISVLFQSASSPRFSAKKSEGSPLLVRNKSDFTKLQFANSPILVRVGIV